MHQVLLTVALAACGDVPAPMCCVPAVVDYGCACRGGRHGLFHGRRFGHGHRGCLGCFGCQGCYGYHRGFGHHGRHGYSGGYGASDCCDVPTLACASCFGSGASSPFPIAVPGALMPSGDPAPASPTLPPVKPMPEPTPTPPLLTTTSLRTREPAQVKAPAVGRIVVDLPADARCYIDERPTRATEARRTFETPDLEPGKVYSYTVRVEVIRNGQTYTRTEALPVVAGETSRANFTDLGSEPGERLRDVLPLSP